MDHRHHHSQPSSPSSPTPSSPSSSSTSSAFFSSSSSRRNTFSRVRGGIASIRSRSESSSSSSSSSPFPFASSSSSSSSDLKAPSHDDYKETALWFKQMTDSTFRKLHDFLLGPSDKEWLSYLLFLEDFGQTSSGLPRSEPTEKRMDLPAEKLIKEFWKKFTAETNKCLKEAKDTGRLNDKFADTFLSIVLPIKSYMDSAHANYQKSSRRIVLFYGYPQLLLDFGLYCVDQLDELYSSETDAMDSPPKISRIKESPEANPIISILEAVLSVFDVFFDPRKQWISYINDWKLSLIEVPISLDMKQTQNYVNLLMRSLHLIQSNLDKSQVTANQLLFRLKCLHSLGTALFKDENVRRVARDPAKKSTLMTSLITILKWPAFFDALARHNNSSNAVFINLLCLEFDCHVLVMHVIYVSSIDIGEYFRLFREGIRDTTLWTAFHSDKLKRVLSSDERLINYYYNFKDKNARFAGHSAMEALFYTYGHAVIADSEDGEKRLLTSLTEDAFWRGDTKSTSYQKRARDHILNVEPSVQYFLLLLMHSLSSNAACWIAFNETESCFSWLGSRDTYRSFPEENSIHSPGSLLSQSLLLLKTLSIPSKELQKPEISLSNVSQISSLLNILREAPLEVKIVILDHIRDIILQFTLKSKEALVRLNFLGEVAVPLFYYLSSAEKQNISHELVESAKQSLIDCCDVFFFGKKNINPSGAESGSKGEGVDSVGFDPEFVRHYVMRCTKFFDCLLDVLDWFPVFAFKRIITIAREAENSFFMGELPVSSLVTTWLKCFRCIMDNVGRPPSADRILEMLNNIRAFNDLQKKLGSYKSRFVFQNALLSGDVIACLVRLLDIRVSKEQQSSVTLSIVGTILSFVDCHHVCRETFEANVGFAKVTETVCEALEGLLDRNALYALLSLMLERDVTLLTEGMEELDGRAIVNVYMVLPLFTNCMRFPAQLRSQSLSVWRKLLDLDVNRMICCHVGLTSCVMDYIDDDMERSDSALLIDLLRCLISYSVTGDEMAKLLRIVKPKGRRNLPNYIGEVLKLMLEFSESSRKSAKRKKLTLSGGSRSDEWDEDSLKEKRRTLQNAMFHFDGRCTAIVLPPFKQWGSEFTFFAWFRLEDFEREQTDLKQGKKPGDQQNKVGAPLFRLEGFVDNNQHQMEYELFVLAYSRELDVAPAAAEDGGAKDSADVAAKPAEKEKNKSLSLPSLPQSRKIREDWGDAATSEQDKHMHCLCVRSHRSDKGTAMFIPQIPPLEKKVWYFVALSHKRSECRISLDVGEQGNGKKKIYWAKDTFPFPQFQGIVYGSVGGVWNSNGSISNSILGQTTYFGIRETFAKEMTVERLRDLGPHSLIDANNAFNRDVVAKCKLFYHPLATRGSTCLNLARVTPDARKTLAAIEKYPDCDMNATMCAYVSVRTNFTTVLESMGGIHIFIPMILFLDFFPSPDKQLVLILKLFTSLLKINSEVILKLAADKKLLSMFRLLLTQVSPEILTEEAFRELKSFNDAFTKKDILLTATDPFGWFDKFRQLALSPQLWMYGSNTLYALYSSWLSLLRERFDIIREPMLERGASQNQILHTKEKITFLVELLQLALYYKPSEFSYPSTITVHSAKTQLLSKPAGRDLQKLREGILDCIRDVLKLSPKEPMIEGVTVILSAILQSNDFLHQKELFYCIYDRFADIADSSILKLNYPQSLLQQLRTTTVEKTDPKQPADAAGDTKSKTFVKEEVKKDELQRQRMLDLLEMKVACLEAMNVIKNRDNITDWTFYPKGEIPLVCWVLNGTPVSDALFRSLFALSFEDLPPLEQETLHKGYGASVSELTLTNLARPEVIVGCLFLLGRPENHSMFPLDQQRIWDQLNERVFFKDREQRLLKFDILVHFLVRCFQAVAKSDLVSSSSLVCEKMVSFTAKLAISAPNHGKWEFLESFIATCMFYVGPKSKAFFRSAVTDILYKVIELLDKEKDTAQASLEKLKSPGKFSDDSVRKLYCIVYSFLRFEIVLTQRPSEQDDTDGKTGLELLEWMQSGGDFDRNLSKLLGSMVTKGRLEGVMSGKPWEDKESKMLALKLVRFLLREIAKLGSRELMSFFVFASILVNQTRDESWWKLDALGYLEAAAAAVRHANAKGTLRRKNSPSPLSESFVWFLQQLLQVVDPSGNVKEKAGKICKVTREFVSGIGLQGDWLERIPAAEDDNGIFLSEEWRRMMDERFQNSMNDMMKDDQQKVVENVEHFAKKSAGIFRDEYTFASKCSKKLEEMEGKFEQMKNDWRRHLSVINDELRNVQNLWASLEQEMCAIWWPEEIGKLSHWQQDKTENKQRMRRKLMRNANFNDHRDVSLQPKQIAKPPPSLLSIDTNMLPKTLAPTPVVEENAELESLDVFATMTGMSSSMDVIEFFKCDLVSLMHTIPGQLEVSNTSVKFIVDKNKIDPKTIKLLDFIDNDALYDHRWPLSSFHEVYPRRYLLRTSAVEFFFSDRTNYLFNLESKKQRQRLIELLRKRGVSIFDVKKLVDYSNRWRTWQISNFEYLMLLNTAAGRTFNDLTQYPVFPWILQQYDKDTLDLDDESNYRDLTKPIGALNDKRYEIFESRYENFDDPTGTIKPFLYGTHYSSAAIVLFYMLRLEPFATLSIDLQSGRFDHADRLFHSMQATWDNSLESTSDVKELIPEFFYNPEFLKNSDGFDLGTTQLNEKLGDVVLPRWATSPEDFIFKHRQALESDVVSAHLHKWIDLIFGNKQMSKEAKNIFFYLTYENAVNVEAIENELERKAIEDQINNFGQTPMQIFKEDHMERNVAEEKNLPPPLDKLPRPDRISGQRQSPGSFDPNHLRIQPHAQLNLNEPCYLACDEKRIYAYDDSSQIRSVHVGEELESSKYTLSVSKLAYDEPMCLDATKYTCLFCVTSDGRCSYSGGHWGGFIYQTNHDTSTFRKLDTLSFVTSVVTALALIEEGKVAKSLIIGCRDGRMINFDLRGNDINTEILSAELNFFYNPGIETEFQPYVGHNSEVISIAVKLDYNLVVSSSVDGTCLVHEITSRNRIRNLVPPDAVYDGYAAAYLIRILEDGSILVIWKCVQESGVLTYFVAQYSINGELLVCMESNVRVNDVIEITDVCSRQYLLFGCDASILSVFEIQSRSFQLITTFSLRTETTEDSPAVRKMVVMQGKRLHVLLSKGCLCGVKFHSNSSLTASKI